MAALSACGGSSTPNTGSGSNAPSQHLYVSTTTQVFQYALPLTSASVPSAALPVAAGALAVDSNGNLAAADGSNHLLIFTAPITSSSTPSATFTNAAADPAGGNGFVAFTPSGDLVASAHNFSPPPEVSQVNVYAHPFSSATTVSQVIKTPSGASIGVAVDGSGNLYVSSQGGFNGFINVFAPPFTGAPVVSQPAFSADGAYAAVAVNGNQVFVCRDTGFLAIYDLPITALSMPSAFLQLNFNGCFGTAIDSTGKLYAANRDGIRVYAPPFSSSSVPILTLGGVIGTIAVGK